MSLNSIHRRGALRLTLGSVSLAFGWCRIAAASEVVEAVEQLYAGLIAIMNTGKTTSFRQRYDMIAPIITRTFDLRTILRQAVGPRWGALPAGEQTALTDAFARFTIASYVANFGRYSGERFDVAPVARPVGGDRLVETRITAASGRAHALEYLMRQEDSTWKVVDVLAEGTMSRVAARRSEIRSVLAEGGGAGLLRSLRQKTAQLSGGILQ